MRLPFTGWKLSRILAAALMLFSLVSPLLSRDHADAAILDNRLIRISSSADGSTADGQGVTYHVEFDIGTTGTLEGIVIDFCANTPIIGDTTCTKTASPRDVPDLDGSGDSLTVSGYSDGTGGTADLTDFTTHSVETATDSQITLTYATGVAVTAGDTGYFDITTADNPENSNTAFFARIYTYDDSTNADNYSVASPGSYVDGGGVALSTAAQITVTAKVAERLVFCLYSDSADPDYNDNDCDSQQGTDVTLGDTNGVLDPSGPFVDKNAKYTVTTNASSGVVIRLKGDTLTSGSDTITEIGATPATANTGGTEQFGLCSYRDTGTTAGLTVDEVYNGATASEAECATTTQTAGTGATGGTGTPTQAEFAFDNNATDGTTSLYGDTLATKTAGDYSTGIIAFVGNISNTTEAGIYTTVLTFIATGTY